ncbi:MAG: glutamate 5-kinase [Elusimicrobia bacterium]|nr:glutamate 5-kinase [Elusimicrobiota bacterium]
MKEFKRIVIKIGTSVLTKSLAETDAAHSTLGSLVQEFSRIRSEGKELLLVTSGAIGMGMKSLSWQDRPQDIAKKQALAALGQVSLMQTYQQLFKNVDLMVAQVLLTRGDFGDRQRYLNARQTLLTLLKFGIVPIINENDTVATEEIRFGDNDQLSALVAAKIDADLLVILSDVDGLYSSQKGKESEILPLIPQITPEIEKLVWKGIKSSLGTGGMASKIDAAKIATASSVTMIIANAFRKNVLSEILSGEPIGTKFVPAGSLTAKEKWILFSAVPKGEIFVDQGAELILKGRKVSLLPAGVLEVKGNFVKKDVVRVKAEDGQEFARGIVSFSSDELQKIKGRKSSEIKKIIKNTVQVEVIHRDSLVLLP